MATVRDTIALGRRVDAHRPWPRVVVTEEQWRSIASELAAGRATLLGLWGEAAAVHMAVLLEPAFEDKLKALSEEHRQHSSLAVLDSLRHPYRAHGPMVGSARFVDGVRGLPVGPDVPHLTQAFIEKCLDDLRRLGLVGRPDADAVVRDPQATVGAGRPEPAPSPTC